MIGMPALLLALRPGSVFSSHMFAYTVCTGGVLVPMLSGFYREELRLTPLGAMAAVSGGGITALTRKLFEIRYLDLGALRSAPRFFSW